MSLKSDSFKKLRKEKKKWRVETPEDYLAREDAFLKERLLGKEPTIRAQVRITAGKAKNINIDIPRNTRPLTDRMKVRLFDILGADIVNKTVLDLFAGSGSFGLEALSRGARSVTFVDASKQAEKLIETNAQKTGFGSVVTVIRSKVEDYLIQVVQEDDEFELIFLDPPYKLYNRKKLTKMQETINNAGKLLPGVRDPKTVKFKGAMLIKHPRRYPIDQLELENIRRVETYDFGLNSVSLFIVAI
jgi:16S rRNA (guanine(966)-N(2))-methyltransferase RsmD